MLLAKNKKALHNYEIVEKYVAGIVLKGNEVKAIREGKVSFEGSYISIDKGIPSVKNMNIGKYSKQSEKSLAGYDEKRPRLILLEQQEIRNILRETAEKGKTAVPLALVLQHNLIKLEVATVKGRKEFEIKTVAKEKQIKKDLQKEAKSMGL